MGWVQLVVASTELSRVSDAVVLFDDKNALYLIPQPPSTRGAARPIETRQARGPTAYDRQHRGTATDIDGRVQSGGRYELRAQRHPSFSS